MPNLGWIFATTPFIIIQRIKLFKRFAVDNTILQYIENFTVYIKKFIAWFTSKYYSINLYIAESVFFPENVAKILA